MPPAYLTAEHPWDLLDWHEAVDALREGHRQGQPRSADIHLHGEHGDLFSRASGIDGVGYGLKAESLFGGNPARGLPTSQCVMLVFAPDDGRLRAMVDSRVITALKTASDSVLAAGYLAAPGSSHLLVVGAGVMAGHLARAYSALFPGLQRISVWSRRAEAAQTLAASLAGVPAEVVAVQGPAGGGRAGRHHLHGDDVDRAADSWGLAEGGGACRSGGRVHPVHA